MDRTRAIAVVVTTTALLSCLFALATTSTICAENARNSRKAGLEAIAAGEVQLIDLTYSINAQNAYWPGEGYEPFQIRTLATIEADGVLSKAISLPEHLGTHIDAPNHFEPNQPAVHEIELQQLFGPGVLLDVTLQAEQNPDYQLVKADIDSWEQAHGRIPAGAIVLLNTGWGRFWNQPERYQNIDMHRKLHFPGFSTDAARFLVEKRNVRGLGIDTLSIDHGLSQDFGVHHVLNSHKRYALENVANLDRLPANGFFVFVAPMKIEGGTGGPSRIVAMIP